MAYEQSAFKRTTPAQRGFIAPTRNKGGVMNRNRPGSNNNFANLIGAGAGLLTAGKDPGYQAQEYADQQLLSEKVLGLTTPNIGGIGYNNTYNQDTGFQSTLTEDNQNLYNQSGDIAGMFSGQIMDYGSGGFEAMERRQLAAQQALVADENERRALEMRERDQNIGASPYGIMQGQMAENNRLNNQNLGFINNAFDRSIAGGNYLSGQRNAALTDRLNIASPGNTMLTNQLSKLDATSNLTNESASLTAKYDAMAAADQAKRKGKNKFWGSVLEMGGNMIMPGAGTVAKAALYA